MKGKMAVVAAGALSLAVLMGGPASAQNRCTGSKLKAAGKKALCVLKLEAKEAATAVAPDPAKIQRCEDRFDSTFSKAEAKGGCLTLGDAAAIEAKVDAFAADVVAELWSGVPSKCQATKIRAAGKEAKCLVVLKAKEAARGTAPDPLKAERCEDRLDSTFEKAETGGGCQTTNDALPIGSKVAAFVDDLDAELPVL